MTFLQFRRQLAKALIYHEHMTTEEEDCTPVRRSTVKATKGHGRAQADDCANTCALVCMLEIDGYGTPKIHIKSTVARALDVVQRIQTYRSCSAAHLVV
jgi:hypothetical protein